MFQQKTINILNIKKTKQNEKQKNFKLHGNSNDKYEHF